MNKRFQIIANHKSRGFTLIEVLVATAIMSILVGSLYLAFRGAIRLRETTSRKVETNLSKSYVMTVLKRDILNIVVPTGIMAGAMVGEMENVRGPRNDRLEFFTTTGVVSKDEPWGDLQKVEYYLIEPETSNGRGGYHLVRAITRNLLASVVEEPEEHHLLSGVQSLEFTYYDGEYWQDSWDSTTMGNENPVAIRIRIEFVPAEGANQETPPMELLCEITVKPRPS